MRVLAATAALLLCLTPTAAQVLTPEDVERLPYDHPVIVDCVLGPPEAESPSDYARIAWVDPDTHRRRVRDRVEVRLSGPALLNVAVASPHRASRCTLSVTLDDRTVLQRDVSLDANGLFQQSLTLNVRPGAHRLRISLRSPAGSDSVDCQVLVRRAPSAGAQDGEGSPFPAHPGTIVLGLLLACRARRW